MTQSELRKKFKNIYGHNYKRLWWSINFKKISWDIFYCFDAIGFTRDNQIHFLQLTTAPNLAARRKKIIELMVEVIPTQKDFYCFFVVAWDKNKNLFRWDKIYKIIAQ